MTPWLKRLPQLPWLWNRNLAPFLSTWDFCKLKNGNKIFPSLDACTFAKWLCLSSHRKLESLSPPLLLWLAICFDYWGNSKADTYRGFKSSLLLFFGNFRHPCEQISGWQTIQSKGPVILDIPAIINQPNHGHMDTAWASRRASKLGSPTPDYWSTGSWATTTEFWGNWWSERGSGKWGPRVQNVKRTSLVPPWPWTWGSLNCVPKVPYSPPPPHRRPGPTELGTQPRIMRASQVAPVLKKTPANAGN